VRVVVDDRVDTPFGRRAVDWELKGVPLRVEVGPRDLEAGTVLVVRRLVGRREPTALADLTESIPQRLVDDHASVLAEAIRSRPNWGGPPSPRVACNDPMRRCPNVTMSLG
jgi:prolyl-tRNA synthetase